MVELKLVSNPIREYLQIEQLYKLKKISESFKPYKGVSSNKVGVCTQSGFSLRFKPYKGVSSNDEATGFQDIRDVFQTL